MTLIPCKACNAPISAAAAACPHCGHPTSPVPPAPRTFEERFGAPKRTAIAIAIPFLLAVVFIVGSALRSKSHAPSNPAPPPSVTTAHNPAPTAAQIAVERGRNMLGLMTQPAAQWPAPAWFDQAIQGLRAVALDAPEHAEAARILADYEAHHAPWEASHDATMAKKKAADEKALAAGREAVREVYGKKLEDQLLSKGFNVDVLVTGAHHERMTIKYVLASKVTAYQLTHSDLPGQWQTIGFRRVTLTDGYDQSFIWDF